VTQRLLQICPHDTPPFDQVCARVMEAAALLGVEVTTIYLGVAEQAPQPNAHYLNCSELSETRQLRRALHKVANGAWDLVLCHRYRAYWSVARTPLARNRCVVLGHEFGLMDKWQRRWARRVWARPFAFAGVSPAVAAQLQPAVERQIVLPNVLNISAARAALLTREQARARLGLPQDVPLVGVVGRLHYKKRPQLAVAAFEVLQRRMPQARLVFVGDGDRSAVPHSPGIHISGFVAQAASCMRAFDVLLHTGVVEAFGMVALEAMAAGVPVVCAPAGGLPYVLGELGHYVPEDEPGAYASMLEAVMRRPAPGYAAAALERIETQFSVPALAHALASVMSSSALATLD